MKDYSKGKIYKIVGNGFTYYGSTCEPTLARRLAKHRSGYNYYLKGHGFNCTSHKCLADDCYIILVENCPCNNKDELYARERHYIENNDCVNKNVPGRTNNEYINDNVNNICEYRRKYRMEYQKINKTLISQKKKKYYNDNHDKFTDKFSCLCGGRYDLTHKVRHLKSVKHISFMDRLNSPDKETNLGAIREIYNRPRHELF